MAAEARRNVAEAECLAFVRSQVEEERRRADAQSRIEAGGSAAVVRGGLGEAHGQVIASRGWLELDAGRSEGYATHEPRWWIVIH